MANRFTSLDKSRSIDFPNSIMNSGGAKLLFADDINWGSFTMGTNTVWTINSTDSLLDYIESLESLITSAVSTANSLVIKGTYEASAYGTIVLTNFHQQPSSTSEINSNGWMWIVTNSSGSNQYFGTEVVENGDIIISKASNPGTTLSNYSVINKNIDPNQFVSITGDTMTGLLVVPSLVVTGTATFNTLINGSIDGNAVTADRLNASAGSALTPVYFLNGLPVACSTLNYKPLLNEYIDSDSTTRPNTEFSSLYVGSVTLSESGVISVTKYNFPSWIGINKPSYTASEINGLGTAAIQDVGYFALSGHTHDYVTSFGTKTGAITVRSGSTTLKDVNFTMNNNELRGTVVIPNFSSTSAGLTPQAPTENAASKFLNGNGTWTELTNNTDTYVNSITFANDTTGTKLTLGRAGTITSVVEGVLPLATATASAVTNGVIKGNLNGATSGNSWNLCKVVDGQVYYYYTTNTNTASAVDDILDGSNTGTLITYKPYAAQQAKLSFDTSSTNPTRTDRLNLNGYLYATKLYSGGSEVVDLGTDQTISGNKTFNGTTTISNLSVSGNSDLGNITSGTWGGLTIASNYLPTATSSNQGVVKVGTTLTATSGYTACPIKDGIIYYKNETCFGTVTQVKVGTTAYNPSSGIISLPAYPSNYITGITIGGSATTITNGVVDLPAYSSGNVTSKLILANSNTSIDDSPNSTGSYPYINLKEGDNVNGSIKIMSSGLTDVYISAANELKIDTQITNAAITINQAVTTTLSANSWTSCYNFATNSKSGTFVLQIEDGAEEFRNYYTGLFIVNGATGAGEEIPLHSDMHNVSISRIYACIDGGQLKLSDSNSQSHVLTIKIVKLIGI